MAQQLLDSDRKTERAAPFASFTEPEVDVRISVQGRSAKKVRWWAIRSLIGFAVITALAAAAWFAFDAWHWESTDDAQIDGHIHPVSSRISGTVISVNPAVENNQYVEAGTVIAEIDADDYHAVADRARSELVRDEAAARSALVTVPIVAAAASGKLKLAQAAWEEAVTGVATAEAGRDESAAKVRLAEADSARAERDRQRFEALVDKREISRSEYDQRETEARTALETLEASRAGLLVAEKRISEARSRVAGRQADVEAARTAPDQVADARARADAAAGEAKRAAAELQSASLNVRYTRIVAPVSGLIDGRAVEVGQRIEPGQALLSILPLDDIWVTANFKETQLKSIQTGQPVKIYVDGLGRDFEGYVESFAGATGSRFSVLPPENATGNYVKVVQRLPVRLRFKPGQDKEHFLRPGMSVSPSVKVR